jgi:hypothetical protein
LVFSFTQSLKSKREIAKGKKVSISGFSLMIFQLTSKPFVLLGLTF